jgi:hypothetical protein
MMQIEEKKYILWWINSQFIIKVHSENDWLILVISIEIILAIFGYHILAFEQYNNWKMQSKKKCLGK